MPQPTNPQAAPADAAPAPGVSGFASAPETAAAPETGATGDGDTPESTQTTEIPEAYRAEDGALDSAKALARLTEIDTAAAQRAEMFGDVPEGDYALGEYELEGGEKVTVDAASPFVKSALDLFKQAGIGQKGADQFIGLYAQALAGDIPKIIEGYVADEQAAVGKEIASLGDKAQVRIDYVTNQIDAALGEQDKPAAGAGKKMLSQIRTRETFELLEQLLQKLDPDQQNRGPGSQASRTSDDPVTLIYGSRGTTQKGAA